MKKFKAILMVFCVVMCLSACKKSKDKTENNVKENKVTQEENTKKENTEKKEDNKKESKKTTSDGEKNESKTEKKDEKSDNKKLVKKTGLFLGLDGSNFAVVIVNDENGNATQLNLQLSKEADMDNSDVEIGDTVNIEYTADETDNKILKKISKAK